MSACNPRGPCSLGDDPSVEVDCVSPEPTDVEESSMRVDCVSPGSSDVEAAVVVELKVKIRG